VFAAGLQTDPQRIGLNSVWNGSDNQIINGQQVHNSGGETCPQCNVKDAMTKSVNTVFYGMGTQIGVNNVRNTAYQAGIPKVMADPANQNAPDPSLIALDPNTHKPLYVEGGISIGQYPVRPVDQAQGYATLANMGNYIPVHFVTKVTDSTGNTLYTANITSKPAFSSDPTMSQRIAHTVVDSMTSVASSSGDPLANNRPNAAKTGTQDFSNPADPGHDADAWMVGFTPQVVTSVWFGHYDAPAPIFGNYFNNIGPAHNYDVYGRQEPAYIWQDFMNGYLANQPVRNFPNIPDVGGSYNFVTQQDLGLPSGPVTTTVAPPTTTTTAPATTTTTAPTTTTTTAPTTTTTTAPTPPPTNGVIPPCGMFGCTGGGGTPKPGPPGTGGAGG
jgi:membrane peptidoglycan carboxypeptidase